jgi:hypothetical protein
MIPVPAEDRSLLISGRAGAKFGRNDRADWVCEAGQFPGREIGLSKNI